MRSPRGPKGAIVGGGMEMASSPGQPLAYAGPPAYTSSPAYAGPPAYASPPAYAGPPAHTSPQPFVPPEHMTEQNGRPKPRIKTTRRCRDIAFLVIFVAFLLGTVINFSWGWDRGNPRRLLYGLDYKGDLCDGDYDVRYWMNPNQVYDSGVVDNPFKIVNARSICLKGCPEPSANGTLSWVCDYPEGPITLSKKQWANQKYDYYNNLTTEQRNSSLKLEGPCYPVLFDSSNFSITDALLNLIGTLQFNHLVLFKLKHAYVRRPGFIHGRSELPVFPVLSSAKRLARYSLGSMAVGSFLVAVIEMIRFLLELIRKKIKLLEAAPGGCCISILCCCAQCCLGCIEWTIKFINRNAYIVIAIKGKGFFGAAAKASGLIVNNILRVATVNILADFVLFLGKLGVAAASVVFAFLMLEQHKYKSGKDKVSSPLFPILFTWIFAYTIAKLFFGVVEMAIDTILLSYCIDCEENNGTARYAPPLLLDTLSRHARKVEDRQTRKETR